MILLARPLATTLLRAVAREITGRLAGPIVECRNRLFDARLRLWTHMRLSVNNARDCLYRHSGEIGYVEDGRLVH